MHLRPVSCDTTEGLLWPEVLPSPAGRGGVSGGVTDSLTPGSLAASQNSFMLGAPQAWPQLIRDHFFPEPGSELRRWAQVFIHSFIPSEIY